MRFVGSETSRAQVTIYQRGDAATQQPALTLRGHNGDSEDPVLVSLEVSKVLGTAAGTFTFEFKYPPNTTFHIEDDDWVDIVFTRHEKRWHVMRGLVDDVRKVERVNASGATDTVIRVSGRDFGKIFEQTPFWFDRVTQGNVMAAAATRMWSEGHDLANGRVDNTVASLLLGFLLPNNNEANALWRMPRGIPDSFGSFSDNVYVYNGDFSNTPPRSSTIYPPYFNENSQSVWSLAQSWSDPMLCEMFVDLVRAGSGASRDRSPYFQPDESYDISETEMAVILRDRPFPTKERDDNLLNAPYFRRLPKHVIERSEINAIDLGHSGRERRNAFFFSPKMFSELVAGYQDMQVPLLNRSSVEEHGMRRLDATSRYISAHEEWSTIKDVQLFPGLDYTRTFARTLADLDRNNAVYITMARSYRRMVRDFHCLNHTLSNGNVLLSRGRPEIRVGSRIEITGTGEPLTAYVEGVTHRWQLESGVRTALTVTRGWEGTDESYVAALQQEIALYTGDDEVQYPSATAGSSLSTVSPQDQGVIVSPPTSERVRVVPGYVAIVGDTAESAKALIPLSGDQQRQTLTYTSRESGE